MKTNAQIITVSVHLRLVWRSSIIEIKIGAYLHNGIPGEILYRA